MTIFNSSSFDSEKMKIPNICLNAITTLILSLISNFKIAPKQSNFRSVSIKFNKITHVIENKLTNEIEKITPEYITSIISEFDIIQDSLEYQYPEHIKKKVKKIYAGARILPNCLNMVTDFIPTQIRVEENINL
jgi:hypothetical protein